MLHRRASGGTHPRRLGGLTTRNAITRVLEWYFENAYGTLEGPGVLPFYCDPARVGHFAVPRAELASGGSAALFQFFIAQAMFQARRDVLIMRQQRAMRAGEVRTLASATELRRLVTRSRCFTLGSVQEFARQCSVRKDGAVVDCTHHRGAPCHVKDATSLFKRVGDMGKLPTAAWLHLFKDGDLRDTVNEVVALSSKPATRADLLVERFSTIHRVGRKLATMFVSALSTPGLAPGLTPWFPEVDGNELVVVDTNVARAVGALRQSSVARPTYEVITAWVRRQARGIDLRVFDSALPSYSPRILQQALYVFCSKSNRVAQDDPCVVTPERCAGCVSAICPFVPGMSSSPVRERRGAMRSRGLLSGVGARS